MSKIKIIIAVILGLMLAAFSAYVYVNYDKFKLALSGVQLRTIEDEQKAYDEGYEKGINDKEYYTLQIANYQGIIESKNSIITELTTQKNVLTNKVNTLTTEKTNLINTVGTLSSTVSDLEAIKTQHENAILQYNTEIISLLSNIETLELDINAKNIEIVTLTNEVNSLYLEVDSLNVDKDNNLSTIEELNILISSKNTEIATLQLELNNANSNIGSFNTQVTNLQSLVSNLESINSSNTSLINTLNIQIVGLNANIDALTLQLQQNTNTITTLNNKITELEDNLNYYEQLLVAYQTEDKVVTTFIIDTVIHNIQVINKNSTVAVQDPTSTDNLEFKGWSLDRENIIDITTYPITEHTTFYAVVTRYYNVKFMYKLEEYATQTVEENNAPEEVSITNLPNETFKGWSLDGETIIDITTYPITSDTILFAVIEYSYNVDFKVDSETVNTQTVIINSAPTTPIDPTREGYTFLGWSLDGEIVINVGDIRVTSNLVIISLWELKTYTITFVNLNGNSINKTVKHFEPIEEYAPILSEITVSYNEHKKVFKDWSLNSTDPISLNGIIATEDKTFYSLSDNYYSVRYYIQSPTDADMLSIQFFKENSPHSINIFPESWNKYNSYGHYWNGKHYNGNHPNKPQYEIDIDQGIYITNKAVAIYMFLEEVYKFEFYVGTELLESKNFTKDGFTYDNLPQAEREGYTFRGWFVGEDIYADSIEGDLHGFHPFALENLQNTKIHKVWALLEKDVELTFAPEDISITNINRYTLEFGYLFGTNNNTKTFNEMTSICNYSLILNEKEFDEYGNLIKTDIYRETLNSEQEYNYFNGTPLYDFNFSYGGVSTTAEGQKLDFIYSGDGYINSMSITFKLFSTTGTLVW